MCRFVVGFSFLWDFFFRPCCARYFYGLCRMYRIFFKSNFSSIKRHWLVNLLYKWFVVYSNIIPFLIRHIDIHQSRREGGRKRRGWLKKGFCIDLTAIFNSLYQYNSISYVLLCTLTKPQNHSILAACVCEEFVWMNMPCK